MCICQSRFFSIEPNQNWATKERHEGNHSSIEFEEEIHVVHRKDDMENKAYTICKQKQKGRFTRHSNL